MADFDQAYFDRYAQQNPEFWAWKQSLDPNAPKSYIDDAGIERVIDPGMYAKDSQFHIGDGRLAGFNGTNYVVYGDAPSNFYDGRNMNAYIYGNDGNLLNTTQAYDVDRDTGWWDNPVLWGALAMGGAYAAYGGAGAGAAGTAGAAEGAGAAGAAEGAGAAAALDTGTLTASDMALAPAAGTTATEVAPAMAASEYANGVAGMQGVGGSGSSLLAAANGSSAGSLSWAQQLAKALQSGSGSSSGGGAVGMGSLGSPASLVNSAQVPKGVDLMPKFDTTQSPLRGYYDELGNSQNVMKLAQALRNPYGS